MRLFVSGVCLLLNTQEKQLNSIIYGRCRRMAVIQIDEWCAKLRLLISIVILWGFLFAKTPIMDSLRSDIATPLLRELHWLPIVCKVDFKLLVFTYKAMHNDAPMYLCDLMMCPYQPTRTLRSANNNMIEVKRTRTKAGDCSITVAAASIWNNLPSH